jgi:sugar phosphate isomerase/epimerase
MRTNAASQTTATDPVSSVLISLSAFGAAEVRRHGQLWFARLSYAAGADGVEVRSELVVDAATELPAIAQAARVAHKSVVYSSADGLWWPDGRLDQSALDHALEATHVLGATRLKMSIGGFNAVSVDTFALLQTRLLDTHAELLIENDQTPGAGTLTALQDFFESANSHGMFPGMTFDIGNWHWNGECPMQAAGALASQVRYVHCKGVQRQATRWVAVPLVDSCAPWRAVLRVLPADVPWAIEYPLTGEDLLCVTRQEVDRMRSLAAGLATHKRTS